MREEPSQASVGRLAGVDGGGGGLELLVGYCAVECHPLCLGSGVAVFQVARITTVCCVSHHSATLCVSITGGSVSGHQDGYCKLC